MDNQIYLDILNCIRLIGDPTFPNSQRQAVEEAIDNFSKMDNAVTYLAKILTEDNESIHFLLLHDFVDHTNQVRHYCLSTLKSIIITRWNSYNNDQRKYAHDLAIYCLKKMKEVTILFYNDYRIRYTSIIFPLSLLRLFRSLSSVSGPRLGRSCLARWCSLCHPTRRYSVLVFTFSTISSRIWIRMIAWHSSAETIWERWARSLMFIYRLSTTRLVNLSASSTWRSRTSSTAFQRWRQSMLFKMWLSSMQLLFLRYIVRSSGLIDV